MTRRSKNKRRPDRSAPPSRSLPGHGEDRAALALTVLWMLALLSCLAAEIGAAACLLAVRFWPSVPAEPDVRRMMAGALLLAAVATGAVCLVLTPLAWWVRTVRPPWPIVVLAVLVGIAPLVTLLIIPSLT